MIQYYWLDGPSEFKTKCLEVYYKQILYLKVSKRFYSTNYTECSKIWYKICLVIQIFKSPFFFSRKFEKFFVFEILCSKTLYRIWHLLQLFYYGTTHFKFGILIKLLKESLFVHEKKLKFPTEYGIKKQNEILGVNFQIHRV